MIITYLAHRGHVDNGTIRWWVPGEAEAAEDYVERLNNHILKGCGVTCRFDTDGTDRWVVFTDKDNNEHIPDIGAGITPLLNSLPHYYMIHYDVPYHSRLSTEDLDEICKGV